MIFQAKKWETLDKQLSSPLFNRIPGEIRDVIFGFALTATVVPHALSGDHDFNVRRGHDDDDDDDAVPPDSQNPDADAIGPSSLDTNSVLA